MSKCVFCEIRDGREEKVFSDSECFIILDIHPVEKGHMLVISNEHFESMLDAPDNLIAHMFLVAKRFAARSKEKLGASGANVATNIGAEAGQIISHFHIHVIPRYKGSAMGYKRKAGIIEKEGLSSLRGQ